MKSVADLPTLPANDTDIYSGQFMNTLASFATEHGPIFKRKRKVTLGPLANTNQEVIYLVGPEANRFVMHTHRQHFSHAEGWTPILGENMGRGLLNMDDPDHARHRKMWNPAFTASCMEAYLPLMQQVIARRTQNWAARREVDVYQEAREITFDVAATALAGFEAGPQVDHLRELFYVLLHGFGPQTGDLQADQARYADAGAQLVAMLLTRIAERRALPEAQQKRDVLGTIVYARDENGELLSDFQVLGHLNILLLAGHETTTTLGAWTLQLLATLPEHRQRIEAELDALLGDSRGVLPVDALHSMKQADYFIREAGRLYPPVMIVPRGVAKAFEFNGYRIPAGQTVRLALGAGHRLPSVFAHPNQFDPDRFAPPREEDKKQQYALVTFGGGPRVCIGINFANIEVKALVAHVLRNFTLEPIPDQYLPHRGFITADLPEGIRVRFHKK